MEIIEALGLPDFKEKQTIYYQRMTLKYLPLMKTLKKNGLFSETPEHDFRGVIRHSLLVSDAAGTLGGLTALDTKDVEDLRTKGILHDSDKRIQLDSMTPDEVVANEFLKHTSDSPLRVTGNNFLDFESWGTKEYILRYSDSISALTYVPWRGKIEAFKKTKGSEDEMGKDIYGMGTWDKLLEIMEKVEASLYEKVVENNASLKNKYPESRGLQRMVQDIIIARIQDVKVNE